MEMATMIKFYRKAATIKAEQFDGSEEMIDKYHIAIGSGWVAPYRINTLEGWVGVQINSWIATGVNGEHWTITDDVFKKTYKELPVIPKYVDDYINVMKSEGKDLGAAFKYWLREDNIDEYMEYNSETFARAWIDGYVVEDND